MAVHNIPNMLTNLRYFISALVPVLYFAGLQKWLVVAVVIGALTDFDGYVARTFEWQSEYGARHDPIADKVFCWSLVIIFWFIDGPHWFLVGLTAAMFAYDLGSIVVKRLRLATGPGPAAKLKTFWLMTGLALMYYATIAPPVDVQIFASLGVASLLVAVYFGFQSGKMYLLLLYYRWKFVTP